MNLNKVLGAVGHELVRLAAKWQMKIPPIQCLVVNQHTGIPSRGIGWFVPDREAFQKGTPQQKRQIVDAMLADVFAFRRWSAVLAEFGLKATKARPKSSPPLPLPIQGGFGGGESEEHKLLKEYVAAHPNLVGLPANLMRGETEFGFPAGDCIDVLFRNGFAWIGAEVKSVLSSEDDIVRGMFQCIKYRALIEAVQKYQPDVVNARVVLVFGKPLPMNLIWARNLLGIEIKEDVQLPESFKARMAASAK